jgi:hypothetical protein
MAEIKGNALISSSELSGPSGVEVNNTVTLFLAFVSPEDGSRFLYSLHQMQLCLPLKQRPDCFHYHNRLPGV